MHIVANRQACRYNPFAESANKLKKYYRRVSYGHNTLGNTTRRLFVRLRLEYKLYGHNKSHCGSCEKIAVPAHTYIPCVHTVLEMYDRSRKSKNPSLSTENA